MTTSVRTLLGNATYSRLPTDVDGFGALAELALDVRWSWNHATDGLWQQLDSALWELTHNPWVVLQTVSRQRLQRMCSDPQFRDQVGTLVRTRRQALDAPGWFELSHPRSPLTRVAYFSMEFMLSEALPIYSGGLGNVAGDQLKAASDLGVPVVGVGLLYQQGYFRQVHRPARRAAGAVPLQRPGAIADHPVARTRMANGCASRSICRATRCGCAPGRCRSGG